MNNKDKYFQNIDEPERILCVLDCSSRELMIMEWCGWKEIFPTFMSKSNQNV